MPALIELQRAVEEPMEDVESDAPDVNMKSVDIGHESSATVANG